MDEGGGVMDLNIASNIGDFMHGHQFCIIWNLTITDHLYSLCFFY